MKHSNRALLPDYPSMFKAIFLKQILGTFAKMQKTLTSFITSVPPFVHVYQLGYHWVIFRCNLLLATSMKMYWVKFKIFNVKIQHFRNVFHCSLQVGRI
jgi:hypothetical protein